MRSAPSVLDDIPAEADRIAIVNEKHAGRALADRLLDFVRPTPIIGFGATFEYLGILGGIPGIVDENNHGLAMHIGVGVIVPGIFRRDDPVADEHEVTVPQFHLR